MDNSWKEEVSTLKQSLKERGRGKIKDFLIYETLMKWVPKEAFPEALEELTPFEFKLKRALSDETKKSEILKIVENGDFQEI